MFMRPIRFAGFGLAFLLSAGAASATPPPIHNGPGLSASIEAPAPKTGEHRERAGLEPGMTIVDRSGRKVGVIVATGLFDHGRPTVRVDDSGSRFQIGVRWLRVSRRGDKAVSRLSRSSLRTRAILNDP
jgi:hypothetical protein